MAASTAADQCGDRLGRVRHVRGWLSLGLVAITAFVLGLNALAQAREHARPSGRTAAHCLGRKLASTLMLAPYYCDESAPLGEWQVTGQVFPPGWGPFLTDISRQSGLGTIVGVIGGYQHGGSASSMSYSSPFGGVLHKLYAGEPRTGRAAGHPGRKPRPA
jgi:hypothetical protein